MVAAEYAAEPKEIPMTKAKSKRQSLSRSNSRKTAGRNSAAQTTAHKNANLNRNTQPAVGQRHRSSAAQNGRAKSKQARIVAMLRAPSGATINAIVGATGWQPHSVRGFLAGVVRKKLSLNLVSAAGENGRVYRIADRTASPLSLIHI